MRTVWYMETEPEYSEGDDIDEGLSNLPLDEEEEE